MFPHSFRRFVCFLQPLRGVSDGIECVKSQVYRVRVDHRELSLDDGNYLLNIFGVWIFNVQNELSLHVSGLFGVQSCRHDLEAPKAVRESFLL